MRHVFPLFALLVIGCDPFAGSDTKYSAAAVKAEHLLVYAKSWSARNEERNLQSLEPLREYSEDGEKALFDPWGEKYQFRYVLDPDTETERLVIWTTEPRSGKVIAAPRQLAHLVEPAN